MMTSLRVWSVATVCGLGLWLNPPASAEPLRQPRPAIPGIAFAPDGSWIAAVRDRVVVLVETETGRIRQELPGAQQRLNAVAVSPDGSLVAAAGGEAGAEGEVLVWHLPEPQPRRWTGHTDSIYALAFSPDGKRLVSGSYDRQLLLWDVAAGSIVATLQHHTGPVFSVQFSPEGGSLVSGSGDQTVKLWNSQTGERIVTLGEASKGINAVAFHPRGTELAAAGIDRTIRIYDWNGSVAKLKRSAFAHEAPVLALAYSPDGDTLFSGSEDRRLKAWEVATLRERHVYPELADWPLTLAVDTAGKQLACGSFDGELTLYQTAAPRSIRTLLAGAPADLLGGLALANLPGLQPLQEQPSTPVKPNPPQPRLDAVSPRTVVRGRTVRLTLSGVNLADADRLFISPAELTTRLLPGVPEQTNQILCEVELPDDFEPGLVSLRLHTPRGSTGARSFYVGPFAETSEKDPNNTAESANAIQLPVTLLGTISARGDIDNWEFEASAGEELVFHLSGTGLGSALQGRLTVRERAGGRLLATRVRRTGRSEVTLGVRIPHTGRFVLEISDRDNTGGGNHFYIAHVGRFPFAEGVFPLAIRGVDQGERLPGEVAEVVARGFNLDGATPLAAVAGTGTRRVPVPVATGRSLNSVRFESSRFAEWSETEPNDEAATARVLPIPSGVSGRISPRSGEIRDLDHFAFEARRGHPLTIEVEARRLGSPLDSLLEILDGGGHPLPRHTLRSVAETYTELRDHDSRSKGIRLHNWEDLAPGDLVLLGGELAKVQIMPLGPDEDVKFFDRGGLRAGFLGTTPEAHAVNRFAYKVELHPPGATFPPNGMPVVQLPWRNDDGGGAFQSDSVLYFDPPHDGRYIVRLGDVRREGGEDHVYRLVVRDRQPDFRVSLDPENPNVPRGGRLPVNVTVERLDDFNAPIDVRVEGLPAGCTASMTRIGPDLQSGVIQIAAAEDAPELTALGGLGWRAVATAEVNGRLIERWSTPGFGGHQLSITSRPDLEADVQPRLARIHPGEEVRFTVSIVRKNGFAGRVPVDVLNLPHGLRVLDVGLNGVLINEEETSRSFVVYCDPWAVAGDWPFFAAPRVESKNERHGTPLIQMEVRAAGAEESVAE